MSKELDFKFGEVNPPVYATISENKADGTLALSKSSKKIKTTNSDMEIRCTNHLVVEINSFKFIFDEELPHWVTILSCTNGADFESIDELDDDLILEISTLDDLKRVALNWYFDNVEIVKEIDIFK